MILDDFVERSSATDGVTVSEIFYRGPAECWNTRIEQNGDYGENHSVERQLL